MTERVKCKKEDCDNLILPATAERTGGYCMPCVQKKEREDRQNYIELNRKDLDPFKDITDPVEIIRLHHVKRIPDPLVRYLSFQGSLEEVYSQLTEFDETRLLDLSIKEAEKGNLEYIEYICLELAAFRSTNLSKIHRFMLSNYSEFLYMEFDTQGNTSWSKYNSRPDYLPNEVSDWGRMPEGCFTLSLNSRPAFYAANQFFANVFFPSRRNANLDPGLRISYLSKL